LSRFLPLVLEGVGAVTLGKIIAYLEDYQYPLAPKFQSMIVDIMTKIQGCWSSKTLIDMCKELLVVSGYNTYLKKEYPNKDDLKDRQENIGEIYSLMLPFDEDPNLDLSAKLTNFLAHISLMSTVDNEETLKDNPKINLMSLHQSKGLEYETVFLVGCEDGLLPHSNSFMEPDGMEEEVRLAYVGVTRAKKNLFLTSADSRITFGQIKANPPSRIFRPFLDKYAKRTK
jgi:DNA helicase-2/ATP-dependent DNA helicase PcrA